MNFHSISIFALVLGVATALLSNAALAHSLKSAGPTVRLRQQKVHKKSESKGRRLP